MKMKTLFLLLGVWISHEFSSVTANTAPIPGVKQHSDVTVNCEDGWYYFSGKCYLLAGKRLEERLPWNLAKLECSKFGAHLVSIHTKKEQEFLTNFLVLNAAFFTWIGLRIPEGGTERVWDDQSKISFTSWNKGEPSVVAYGDIKEDCVEMKFQRGGITGNWNDVDCNQPRAYICEKDTDPSLSGYNMKYCSPDVRGGYNFHESCYHIVTTPKTWQEAETFCQDTFSGHLVSVQDFAVNEFISYIQKKNRHTEDMWIGLTNTVGNGIKTWSSGWALTFTAWKSTSTPAKLDANSCVVTSSANWDVNSCDMERPFICEYSLKRPPVYTPSTVLGSYCPEKNGIWHDLGGDFCYHVNYLIPPNEDWYRANYYCNRRGGTLASVHSKEMLDMLEPFVRYLDWIYIGLFRDIDGHFTWIDRTDFDFKFWQHGQPNNFWDHCSVLETQAMALHNAPCEDKRPFLCSTKKIPGNVTVIEEEIVCSGELYRIV